MTLGGRARALAGTLVGIAQSPDDDDDTILAKRVGVAAGYISILASAALPLMTQGHPLSWFVAATMLVVNSLNLAVLARTGRFDRYVVVLLLSVMILPAVVEVALGGLAGASAAFVFAFLGPVYAILVLGPRRATPYFLIFLALLVGVAVLDPLVSSTIAPQPYESRLVFYVANLGVPLGLTFAVLRYTERRQREAQARADELLTNAIPRSVALRLKRGEERIAESYPMTTVLFADLVGFTPWARQTGPENVVAFLDALFTRFDALALELGVEKIKTIGDEYMAVAGAPEPNPEHASAALEMATRMLVTLDEVRAERDAPLALRIGVASGPAIGGVIGTRRITFDLWGDTINTASRMQSYGVPGRIQVASSTRDSVGAGWSFEDRQIDVKGLGPMTAYLVR